MKLRYIFILMLLIASCKASKKLDLELAPIIKKAKETSLYAARVDWNAVNKKYIALTQGKTTIEEKKAGYEHLINSLGDKHATIRKADDYSIVAYYTGAHVAANRQYDQEFLQTEINNPQAKFSFKKLEEGIGLLKVVGIGPGDVKVQSDEIRTGLKELKKQKVNKWIVDLRSNGGGNIEPMISGLAPLIGEGKIGGSVNLKGDQLIEYTIEDAQFYNYGRLVCEMEQVPSIATSEKVVVLLSRYTVSSGEMLAIAFKGRPNTIFIGEDSGGLTTGNGFDLIDNEVYLVISNGVFSDRNNKAYNERVEVDEQIEFDHTASIENDQQILRAKEWLKE